MLDFCQSFVSYLVLSLKALKQAQHCLRLRWCCVISVSDTAYSCTFSKSSRIRKKSINCFSPEIWAPSVIKTEASKSCVAVSLIYHRSILLRRRRILQDYYEFVKQQSQPRQSQSGGKVKKKDVTFYMSLTQSSQNSAVSLLPLHGV